MVSITEQLELILRLGPDFDGNFDALVEAAQGNGWEASDARWTVTRRLDEYELSRAVLRQLEIWDAHGVGDVLTRPLLEIFSVWADRGRPSLKFRAWADELVHELTASQLLGLARALEQGDQVLPDGLKVRKLASALKVIVAIELERRLIEAVRRWERQGHFEHGRDGAKLARSAGRPGVRDRPRRDRKSEPLEPPYVPPSTQDVRRAL